MFEIVEGIGLVVGIDVFVLVGCENLVLVLFVYFLCGDVGLGVVVFGDYGVVVVYVEEIV